MRLDPWFKNNVRKRHTSNPNLSATTPINGQGFAPSSDRRGYYHLKLLVISRPTVWTWPFFYNTVVFVTIIFHDFGRIYSPRISRSISTYSSYSSGASSSSLIIRSLIVTPICCTYMYLSFSIWSSFQIRQEVRSRSL